MIKLCGTFDSANADWNKLIGEGLKSIDDIDVIRLHDKTTDKDREFVALDRTLEIIDTYKYDQCFSTSEKLWNENMYKIKAEVLALKGEQNGRH